MRSVLLATCEAFPDGDDDASLLLAALGEAGVEARSAVWTDPGVDWDEALVVLRSTWDYTLHYEAFLHWVRSLRSVVNAADVVEWNTDKIYLRDLAAWGVPTVDTRFAAPGTTLALPEVEFVVKPSVGAGSRGVGRFTPDQGDEARRHLATLGAAGRTALVQPYLGAVDTAGETALVYVDGQFSHAVRKGPMLRDYVANSLVGDSLYFDENISPRTPGTDELEVGAATMAQIRRRFGADLLYARVDLLSSPSGPRVVELELTEPSLFLVDVGDQAAAAADRLAVAIAARA